MIVRIPVPEDTTTAANAPAPIEGRESLAWIDIARTLAALAVVAVHVTGRVVANPRVFDTLSWWMAHIYNSASRWCVPVFIMLSGALLLYGGRDESVRSFYLRRARRVLFPLVFWSVVYLYYRYGQAGRLTPGVATRAILTGTPYYHLWYLYMVVGLYLMVPFLRTFVRNAPASYRRGAIVLALTAAVIDTLLVVGMDTRITSNIIWMSIPFVGYFLTGYDWRLRIPGNRPLRAFLWFLGTVVLIVFGGYAGYRWFEAPAARLYAYKFLSIPVITTAMCFTWFLQEIDFKRYPRFSTASRHIGKLTLGIYLIHPIVLRELAKMGVAIEMTTPVASIPLVIGITFALSAGITYVFTRIPGLRWTV